MKIALLNLPLDNNYGGNLQRFALMKVLSDMGHDVTHIKLVVCHKLPWWKMPYSYPKRLIFKYLLRRPYTYIFLEKYLNKKSQDQLKLTTIFYNKYIQHSVPCTNVTDVKKVVLNGNYNAVVVGSDQVWRKSSNGQLGMHNYMLKFLDGTQIKRYAYAVSFGISGNLLSNNEIKRLSKIYNKFESVSVREYSALNLLNYYNWSNPKAELCLDPTLLLDNIEYDKIISESDTVNSTQGKIFCYILDKTELTRFRIDYYKKEFGKDSVEVGLNDTASISIPQWLNNIKMADCVITDSYHGVVFSIIYRKSVYFLGNKSRGNSRIESLFKLLGINDTNIEQNYYVDIEKRLNNLRDKSIYFLKNIQ